MCQGKVVLLSGLVGSGKSTILHEMEKHGVTVISMDDLFKEVVYQVRNRPVLHILFGIDVLRPDGSPDKDLLRALFFSLDAVQMLACKERLEALSATFSGCLLEELKARIAAAFVDDNVSVVVVESATALANGWHSLLQPHETVVLHCSQEVRLERLRLRNPRISDEMYLAIMGMQPTDDELFVLGIDAQATHFSTECPVDEMLTLARQICERLTSP